MSYQYKLIIQFPENDLYDYDWIVEMEDKLEAGLDVPIDGHDIGSGESNIFINTNDATKTFELVKNILREDNPTHLDNIKAAYRERLGEQYFYLWPNGLTEFKVS